MTQRPVVNLNEIELMPQSPQRPERVRGAFRTDRGTPRATKLGCRPTVLSPGKRRSRTMSTTSMTSCS
jgi:hypothetical protein